MSKLELCDILEKSMEARNFEESDYTEARADYYAQAESVTSLTQEYKPLPKKGQQSRKKRRRELSFFLHVSVYSVLFMLFYPIFTTSIPFILSFPISLILPIGVILGSKRFLKRYVLKK
ncbi:MAG: DUF3270 family protein [Streptococcaceae bacterium]|nr:DUF3270 family protein [Streptococcaceae bacterium]